MMNIFILTEGGKNVGFGHITRCISIFQAFEFKGFNPTLIVNGDENVKPILQNVNYEIFDWIENKNILFEKLKNSDIVVVDSYLANLSIYKKISELCKLTVYFDDTKRLNYPKGIVINGAVGAENMIYPEKKEIKYLLGVRYQPMRKAFWKESKKNVHKNIDSVLVTFGGNDMRNLTPKVLNLLNNKLPEISKNVLIGRAFNNVDEIKKVSGKNTFLYYNLSDEEIKNLMFDSDIAVSAAGQTIYELASVGTPVIAVGIINNQINIINGLKNKSFFRYAGWWEDKNLMHNISRNIEYMKNINFRKSINKTKIIDGRGSLNIVDKIMDHYDK